MPLEGRILGGVVQDDDFNGAVQGDVFVAMQIWRETDGCRLQPDLHETRGEYQIPRLDQLRTAVRGLISRCIPRAFGGRPAGPISRSTGTRGGAALTAAYQRSSRAPIKVGTSVTPIMARPYQVIQNRGLSSVQCSA